MSAPAPLRIRKLRLVGARRDYEVEFETEEGLRNLAVIAGQIATGKTTVLDFINWCLGGKRYPEHEEIISNVRTAQLAIDVLDRQSAYDGAPRYLPYIIDRPLGGASTKAWLYSGGFPDMSEVPLRSLTADPADPESLSQWLLLACGLSGLHIKQAPTKTESKTSVLSFLDLRPLWFLSNKRMGSTNLALEGQPQVAVKFVQAVDFLFGVSDDEVSALARRIEELSTEERELGRSLVTLNRFLDDAEFQNLEEIALAKDEIGVELAAVSARQRAVSMHLRNESTFAEELRREYDAAVIDADILTSRLRDRDTLSRRLNPLRAQYADELRRLELLDESLTLFDTLTITTCPACQATLSRRVEVVGGVCTLCEQPAGVSDSHPGVAPDDVEQQDDSGQQEDGVDDAAIGGSSEGSEGPGRVDLASERRSLRRRLNQLKEYSLEVGSEVNRLEAEVTHARAEVRARQRSLDDATRETVSPYLALRDRLATRSGELTSSLRALKQSERVMAQLAQMERDHRQVASALNAEKERQRARAQTATDRDAVLMRLATRMESILRDFGFPKVDQVRIDRKLVPFVRGKRYDRVGSSGAMTLITLAWTLSIFELSVESGGGHPGFLLVDGPQQNLLPDAPDEDSDGELSEELRAAHVNIATNVYTHIRGWLEKNPTAQIIVVDNAPPTVAKKAIAVRYSGDPLDPPYGLIDNADGRESDQ